MKYIKSMFVAIALIASTSVMADEAAKSVVIPQGDLTWKDMGIPGVVSATVSGDMATGASEFFLKYPVGFVTPPHHHSADHHVTVISGSITLTVDGKDHLLGPGSYFTLLGKAVHTAKVEGNEDAVFFIQAQAPWDVVMQEKAQE